jgi:hypothetical protein
MIGKYGVEIFAPAGVIKGLNKYRALKRANTMCTIEACVISKSAKAKIIKESSQHAIIRQSIIEKIASKAKIYPKNPNVIPHLLKEKHEWGKVITAKIPIDLKENLDFNFRAIVDLLEKEEIISSKYFTQTTFAEGSIKVNMHTKFINDYKVEVLFEVNSETNTVLLQNGWVNIK